MLSRRQALTATAGLAAALASGTPAVAGPPLPRRRIPYGSCLSDDLLQKDPEYTRAIETYCQQVTPEGGLYWVDLRPTRNQFNFDRIDRMLAFAEANEMTMRGHTLVWYGAMPAWTNEIGSAAEAERELTTHIERVVSRYRGRIKIWHVVNEAIDETKGAEVGLRPNVWLKYLGPTYIDLAFRVAHQTDPAAELVLNDYNVESMDDASAPRRRALLKLVDDLLARGVPINGVGLQGHIPGQYAIDRDGLHEFASRISAAGLSVHVTELDVIDDELPAPVAVRDAIVASRAYDFLDSIFAAARPAVIATWGITDRYSWVPMWHKRKDGLINRPLPFDEFYRPKPMWSVIDYFCQKTV